MSSHSSPEIAAFHVSHRTQFPLCLLFTALLEAKTISNRMTCMSSFIMIKHKHGGSESSNRSVFQCRLHRVQSWVGSAWPVFNNGREGQKL